MARPASPKDVERELARARGARRLLPWAVASALAAGALVGVAGAGWKGGLVVALVGLVFAAFTATAAVARCPSCGASLSDRAGRSPGCPTCRVRAG